MKKNCFSDLIDNCMKQERKCFFFFGVSSRNKTMAVSCHSDSIWTHLSQLHPRKDFELGNIELSRVLGKVKA